MQLFNLSVAVAGIVICLFGLLQLRVGVKTDRRTDRYFRLVYTVTLLFALANAAGQLMRGHPGSGARTFLYITNFCEFLMPCLLVFVVTRYLLSLIDPDGDMPGVRAAALWLLAAHTALLVIAQVNGMYYVIDAANVYRRASMYPLSYVMTAAMMVIDVYLLIKYRNRLSEKERAAFWIYMIVPVIPMILQIFIYGIYLVVFGTVIACIAMYIFILADSTERYYKREKENTQLRVDIMLSQIQPHFLYNSLWTIKALCREDPEKAEQAMGDFANYLRHNMDSIGEDKPIPFTEELEHTKLYIEIQKLRFGDELNVEYDLKCTDFEIPTLTLQPIVENAVRHGVRKSKTGRGTVSISTLELEDSYVIRVSDDGPGFPTTGAPDDGRSHIGIKNVRERLERVCGGTLVLDSAPGRGAVVCIFLPKGGAAADGNIRA